MNEEKITYQCENVLITVSNPKNATNLVRLAAMITTPRATLHVLNITKSTYLIKGSREWRKGSQLVIKASHYANQLNRIAMPLAKTSTSISKSIITTSKELNADLIILGWFSYVTPLSVESSEIIDNVLRDSPCDTAVCKFRDNILKIEKILIPTTEKIDERTLMFADHILKQTGATGELIHVVMKSSESEQKKAQKLLENIAENFVCPVNKRIITSRSVVEGLIKASEKEDLILIEANPEWVFNEFLFGRIVDRVAEKTQCSVVIFEARKISTPTWSKFFFRGIKRKIIIFLNKFLNIFKLF